MDDITILVSFKIAVDVLLTKVLWIFHMGENEG